MGGHIHIQLIDYVVEQKLHNIAKQLYSNKKLLKTKYIYTYTNIYTYTYTHTGNPLQDSCLENSMDRGAWWAAIHGVTESRTRLSD